MRYGEVDIRGRAALSYALNRGRASMRGKRFMHNGHTARPPTSPPSAPSSPSIWRSCLRSGSLMTSAASAASAASSESRSAFCDCSAAARRSSACLRSSRSPASLPPADPDAGMVGNLRQLLCCVRWYVSTSHAQRCFHCHAWTRDHCPSLTSPCRLDWIARQCWAPMHQQAEEGSVLRMQGS